MINFVVILTLMPFVTVFRKPFKPDFNIRTDFFLTQIYGQCNQSRYCHVYNSALAHCNSQNLSCATVDQQ